jgi:hypothetical protein
MSTADVSAHRAAAGPSSGLTLVQLAVAFAVRHPSVTSASRRRQAAHPQEEQ